MLGNIEGNGFAVFRRAFGKLANRFEFEIIGLDFRREECHDQCTIFGARSSKNLIGENHQLFDWKVAR